MSNFKLTIMKTIYGIWVDNGEMYEDHYAGFLLEFYMDAQKAESKCIELRKEQTLREYLENERYFQTCAWVVKPVTLID